MRGGYRLDTVRQASSATVSKRRGSRSNRAASLLVPIAIASSLLPVETTASAASEIENSNTLIPASHRLFVGDG